MTRPPNSAPSLLPYQAEFVDIALDPEGPSVTVLRRELGLGGNYTLTVAAINLLTDHPQARVLFLTPQNALAEQIAERLRLSGTAGERVDRYRFRELVSVGADDVWPAGAVSIVSYDFAKQADVRESMAASHWDMVIAEDADYATGARAQALLVAASSSSRCIVAVAIEPAPELSSLVEGASVVVWKRDSLMQGSGAGESSFAPEIDLIRYTLTPKETALATAVSRLNETLSAAAEGQVTSAVSNLLDASSPLALDEALQRILLGEHLPPAVDEPLDSGDSAAAMHQKGASEQVMQVAAETLRSLNDVDHDSKLNALSQLLESGIGKSVSSGRTCVAASSKATLYYLSSHLEDLGVQHIVIHSGMSPADRADSLAAFLVDGGILLSTFNVLKGIGLPTVADLVLYDLPGSRTVASVVIGVFDCIGRTERLRIHLLAPANEPAGIDTLSAVRNALLHGDPTSR